VTTYDPTIELAVNVAVVVAVPVGSVVAIAVLTPPVNVPVGPLTGAVNVTGAPLTGVPMAFLTTAVKCSPNAVLIAAVCDVPAVAVMVGTIAVLLSEKVAGNGTPDTVAVTTYGPGVEFAVKKGASATPFIFVITMFEPVKAPPAPAVGGENVTVTPLTGRLVASLTVAANWSAN